MVNLIQVKSNTNNNILRVMPLPIMEIACRRQSEIFNIKNNKIVLRSEERRVGKECRL